MLWSTSLLSDSSTCVSHFISEMIFDRVINSTPVAVWCRKPVVWPRNHEHKVVLSVLYLTFFDSIQQNSSTIWFLDLIPKVQGPPRRDLNFSEMRSQRFRPNASAAQAATRSQKRLDQWWVTILHWQIIRLNRIPLSFYCNLRIIANCPPSSFSQSLLSIVT